MWRCAGREGIVAGETKEQATGQANIQLRHIQVTYIWPGPRDRLCRATSDRFYLGRRGGGQTGNVLDGRRRKTWCRKKTKGHASSWLLCWPWAARAWRRCSSWPRWPPSDPRTAEVRRCGVNGMENERRGLGLHSEVWWTNDGAAAVVVSVPMQGGKVFANTSRLTIKQQWHAAEGARLLWHAGTARRLRLLDEPGQQP